jgi:hypothetical protein
LVVHTELTQSPAVVQAWPLSQRLQLEVPPQSTPLSLPFFTTSVQLGCWQTLLTHTCVLQSVPELHCWPGVHFVAQEPPQSTALSFWFLTPSIQLAI